MATPCRLQAIRLATCYVMIRCITCTIMERYSPSSVVYFSPVAGPFSWNQARHSQSPETIEFLKLKAHDSTWIERDVVLEEINKCATRAGFSDLMVVPVQHPMAPSTFTLRNWSKFRRGNLRLRLGFARKMAVVNYDQRVVFYCDKPAAP